MNKLSLLLVVILLVIPFTSCSEDIDYNALITGAMKPTNDKVAVLEQARGTLETRVKAVEDGKASIEFVNNKVSGLTAPNLSSYYTSAQVDAAIKKALDDYKATIAGGSSGTQTPSNPTGVIGQISYSIDPVQQFYQFSTGATIKFRIFNNKSESRYVRPQITLTTYGGTTTGTLPTTMTASVVSNSQGQANVTFSSNPIPSTGAVSQIIFTSYSGGISNGQYLLGSGSIMDLYITITVSGSSTAALWTMVVSGSDTSLSGT